MYRPVLKKTFHPSKRSFPPSDDSSDTENVEKASKAVKFNSQIIETSFGGTQTSTRLKSTAGSPVKVSVNVSVSSSTQPSSTTSRSSLNASGSSKSILSKSTRNSLNIANRNKLRASTEGMASNHNEKGSRSALKPKQSSSTLSSQSSSSKVFDTLMSKEKDKQEKLVIPDIMKTPVRRSMLENRMVETPDMGSTYGVNPAGKMKRHSSTSELSFGDSNEDSSGVTVAVRVRPYSARELADENVKCVVAMNSNQTTVTADNGQKHHFTYDFSFWSFDHHHGDFSGQEYIYNVLGQPLLGKAFEGYNTCLFAYGQTGSGKSYSIMGHGDEIGIIPRFCEDMFIRRQSIEADVNINIEISFFEIYNERIHDLLSSQEGLERKAALKVREHPVLGPYVEDLQTHVVNSFEDIQGWINLGNKQRATAATGMNDKSSRSHSVFMIVMTQTRHDVFKTEYLEGEKHEHSITSKINLVDLAGSERQTTAQTSGQRLREGANINKSLHALGKVISFLSEQSMKKKKLFIPYRDSVLTWLLKESLGGNSKTAMIATISPANHHTEETLSTLRYAKQARTIVNTARVNEDPKARIIRELRAEIEKLRGSAGVISDDAYASSLAEISSLKDRLTMKEREMAEATRSWQERLKRSEEKKLEESRLLEKSGVAFKIDNSMPNLVNLNEDPQLSEMLLYVIKEGQTKVGRMKPNGGSKHDIQLQGALIADDHCIINNVDTVVSITPIKDAPTYVNGELITGPSILHHGDRVILGGDHYFRFNHPIEVQKGRKPASSGAGQIKDFEFARQELERVQDAKLQAELEEARREAQREMEERLEKTRKEAELELSIQRHGYEDKLSELEKELKKQYLEKAKSDKDKVKAESVIDKLEQQKKLLEQEVLSNRRRLEMEAQAAQKAAKQSRVDHFKILEQLEKEKQKLSRDVQRLEAMKQRKGSAPNTPVTPLTTTKKPRVDGGRMDLYRIALLLREANKISQFLKKDTTFMREDVEKDGSTQTLIKVTNTKMSISTFWTVAKFEDKLIQMRELYQGDTENNVEDEVFYDPNDSCWEKDDRVSSPVGSPRLMHSLTSRGQRMSSRSSIRQSLASYSSAGSTKSPARTISISSDTKLSVSEQPKDAGVPVISMCRDFISLALDRFRDTSLKESLADKLLGECETLKLAITTLLDAFNKTNENSNLSKADFIHSEVVKLSSIQITSAMNRIISNCSLWSNMCDNVSSSLVKDLTEKMVLMVKRMGSHLVLFMQGCENDIDTMVQQSSSHVLDALFNLCKHSGQLALATDTKMAKLMDNSDQFDTDEDDSGETQIGPDIKQSFLSGCDTFVDKTLQSGLKSVEDVLGRLQTCSEEKQKPLIDVVKHVEILVATTKILLLKCQEVQVELDTTMRDSSEHKSENFYHQSYKRSQRLVAHISSLVDGMGLLLQAMENIRGPDTDLRRVQRIAELVLKSTARLVATSTANSDSARHGSGTDSQSECSETSILTDSQSEQVELAGQEVQLAAGALITFIKKQIKSDSMSETQTLTPKTKRMLPMSPGKGVPAKVPTSPELLQQSQLVRKNLAFLNNKK